MIREGFEVLTAHGRDAARWQSFVDALPYHFRDIHLTPGYARVQETCNETDRFLCAVFEWQDQFILQPFQLRTIKGTDRTDITSMYGFGGPASNSNGFAGPRLWAWLDEAMVEWRKEHRVVSEYCALNPMLVDHQARLLRDSGVVIHTSKEVAFINVDQTDEYVIGDATKSRQSAIKRVVDPKTKLVGAQGGASGCLPVEVASFFGAYTSTMKRHAAGDRWLFPFRYFLGYFQHLPDDHRALISTCVPHVGASAIVLAYGRCAYYHFAARADISSPGSGEALIMAAVDYARAARCRWLHLGGGVTAAEDDSLWAFKSSWSQHRAPVCSYRRIFDTPAYLQLCELADVDASFVAEDGGFFPEYRRPKEAA